MSSVETGNLLTWVGAIALIGGFGIAVMIWAYAGSGSHKVVFSEPVSATSALPDAVTPLFEDGGDAYRQGKFERAIAAFNRALQAETNLAEAHHNLGRLQANLKRDNEAVRRLVRAGELYLEAENGAGYEAVKADLEALKKSRT
ncbi:MAG: tetratricopeptide repeat protein [Cyanobacteria bacterium J06638_22]